MRLSFNQDNKFKILQITDLHLKNFPFDYEDLATLEMIRKMIHDENPDLLIFTGDIIWSIIIDDPITSYKEFIKACNTFEVPIAITYGNHDANHPNITREILRMEEKHLTNFVVKNNPYLYNDRESYTIEIYNNDKSKVQQVLFIVDSGTYSSVEGSRYEWITQEQINWILTSLRSYEENTDVEQFLFFQHIPLKEFYQAYALKNPTAPLRVDFPDIDEGYLDALTNNSLVKALFVGHNHNNNYEVDYRNMKLVFGQVSGYSAESLLPRGVRVITLEKDVFSSHCIYDYV